MGLKIFATGNEVEKLQPPFKSRFMEFYLSEYSLYEFEIQIQITKLLLHSRYKPHEEVASAIADVVWNDIKTKDIRDVLQTAKFAHMYPAIISSLPQGIHYITAADLGYDDLNCYILRPE